MKVPLFVYGTLLPGEPGFSLVEPYIVDRTPGAVFGVLYAGEYPVLVAGGGTLVYGEWYGLKPEALDILDPYEEYYGPGHADNEYERVWITDAAGIREGWTYAVPECCGLPRVPSGSWKRHLKEAAEQYRKGILRMVDNMILLATDSMGSGDKELGEQLLETYFTLLKQSEQLPGAVFCLNRGVLALTEESFASVHLKELADKGVSVLACKTCVEHYGITDRLYAGEISSMARFIELSGKYRVLTIA